MKYIENDEIKFDQILDKLTSNKLLIFLIVSTFTFAAYLYASHQTKIYKSEIVIKKIPAIAFEPYQDFFQLTNTEKQYGGTEITFQRLFQVKLLSRDLLNDFYEKNDFLNTAYRDAKLKKPSVIKLEKKKVNQKKIFEDTLIASLTFPEFVKGNDLLISYINYINILTIDEFVENLRKKISYEIDRHKKHYEIAKEINLIKPLGISKNIETYFSSTQPDDLFYEGTIVIEKKLDYLEQKLDKVKAENFKFNLVIDYPQNKKLYSTKPIYYVFVAFILSLFLSFVIVIIKKN